MSGPVAIITGAARGIGAACARALAAEGWDLVLVDRATDDTTLPYPLATEADLAGVVADCGRDHAVGVKADVRDQTALDDAVALAVSRFGGLDASLAAAGCIAGAPGWATDDDLWSAMIDINLGGVRRLARASVPALLRRPEPRSGRFVAISSAGGTLGLPLLTAYTAAKHGVNGFIRSLAAELGPLGITANAVAPGSTATAMLDASAAVYGLSDVSEFIVHHQLGRLVQPQEVASLVCWLCGPASAAITGAVLPVDAGMTAG